MFAPSGDPGSRWRDFALMDALSCVRLMKMALRPWDPGADDLINHRAAAAEKGLLFFELLNGSACVLDLNKDDMMYQGRANQ